MRLHTNAETIFIIQHSCAISCIMGLECRAQRVITDETAQSSLLGARIVEEVTPPQKKAPASSSVLFCGGYA